MNNTEKKQLDQIEIERKYVILKPDMTLVSGASGYTESRITQTYLESPEGQTRRVRKREYADRTEYFETVKIRIDKMSSREIEREIDESEYLSLLNKIKAGTRPILKTRLTFPYNGRIIEIDLYPEWKDTCIMEIELPAENETVSIPEFVRILKEVTGDHNYSNASMSRSFPPELSL